MTPRPAVGLAVIGCGTIGSNRARVARLDDRVGFLGVCDLVEDKARAVAGEARADTWATDHEAAILDERVDAVVVATTEGSHFQPAALALEAGKPVLVEKPFALTIAEAKRLLELSDKQGAPLYVGYTQRFRRRFVSAKEEIRRGKLGKITSAFGKIYVARSVAEAVMERERATSPSLNTLTYVVDLVLWYLDGAEPVSVYAAGAKGHFWERFGVHDSTWAVVRFDDDSVATMGVSWELPEFHPAFVASMELDVLGRKGSLTIDDAHRDVLLVSTEMTPSPYTPKYGNNVALLGSAMPGDWALGRLHGPMREETRAFVDSVESSLADPVLCTGAEGYRVLALTLAIDEALQSETVVDLRVGAWKEVVAHA